MPKSLNCNDKRVFFPKNKQKDFLIKAVDNSDLSWIDFSKKFKIHIRTLNDWKREKYSIPLYVLDNICKILKLDYPKTIEIKDKYWYTKKGGKASGKLVYKRYGAIGGDLAYRKQKWLEWWNKTGKYNLPDQFIAKKINLPDKTKELAEFTGILIGDGGITKRQVTVSLNFITDSHYIIYVKRLIQKLFKIEPALYKRERETVTNIVISRTELVLFCKSLGLKVGNKLAQNLDIPLWVKRNTKFIKACIRGLMDTDGCIFNECHNINNRQYCYPRLSLVSASKQLLKSVLNLLIQMNFHPVIRNNRSVQLEKSHEIIRFFNIIGTNNMKHKKRFQQIMLGGIG